MAVWSIVLWSLGAIGCGIALYGLHRLALWLEDRGHLYYLRKQPGGTSTNLLALQQIVEPQVRHVREIRDHQRKHTEEDGPTGPPLNPEP